MFTAIVYVFTSGCAWRHLPLPFCVSVPTVHRRVAPRVKAGVLDELHRQVPDWLRAVGDLDWSAAIPDAAHVRAKMGDL